MGPEHADLISSLLASHSLLRSGQAGSTTRERNVNVLFIDIFTWYVAVFKPAALLSGLDVRATIA